MSCFLDMGSRGNKVTKLEIKLKDLGYYKGIIDDKYGPVLRDAVRRYQGDNGLQKDCVGPITWNKLFPNTAAPAPGQGWIIVPSYKYEKQDTGWTCGPSSEVMALSELGITVSEDEMAKLAGTVPHKGTGHSGLLSAILKVAQKFNVKLTAYEKNFSEVGWKGLSDMIQDPNISVIVHGVCAGWPRYWTSYKKGHYVFPIGINITESKIRIADPIKGVIDYPLIEFKQGMSLLSQPSLIIIKKK